MAPLPGLTEVQTNRIYNKWLTSIRQRKPSIFQSTVFRSRAGSISRFSPSSGTIGSTTADLDIAHTASSVVFRTV